MGIDRAKMRRKIASLEETKKPIIADRLKNLLIVRKLNDCFLLYLSNG